MSAVMTTSGWQARGFLGAVVTLTVSAAALGGCQSGEIGHAGPTKLCGTTLARSAAGPVVWYIPREDAIPPLPTSASTPAILAMGDCRHGRTVSFEPSRAVTVDKTVEAHDGLTAGLLIHVSEPGTVVVVVQQDHEPPSRTTLEFEN
jgi:hypothetical protein